MDGESLEFVKRAKWNMEWLTSTVRDFLVSPLYSCCCILLIFANIGMLIWEILAIIQIDKYKLFDESFGIEFYSFLSLELLLNCFFIGDIILRVLAQMPLSFYHKMQDYVIYWGNILDVVILLFSLSSVILFLISNLNLSLLKELPLAVAFTALSFRWIISLARIILNIRNQANRHSTERIDLSNPKLSGAYGSTNEFSTSNSIGGGLNIIEEENIFDSFNYGSKKSFLTAIANTSASSSFHSNNKEERMKYPDISMSPFQHRDNIDVT